MVSNRTWIRSDKARDKQWTSDRISTIRRIEAEGGRGEGGGAVDIRRLPFSLFSYFSNGFARKIIENIGKT